MNVRPEQIPYRDFYRILLGSVAPRPIAWVSTLNKGLLNLAPFPFFNAVSAKPPMLGFSPSLRLVHRQSAPKDTLHNIRETGEFVVNVVTFAVADAMNLTSGDYDSSVDEFALAKLTTRPSQVVCPPQVAESPVSFECNWDRAAERKPGDRRDRLRSPGGQRPQRRPPRSRFARPDWAHGWHPVLAYHQSLRPQAARSAAS
jgi:flavin reductase (DIM6/NTAB) family NADH-FMN oxidoreductase RutF